MKDHELYKLICDVTPNSAVHVLRTEQARHRRNHYDFRSEVQGPTVSGKPVYDDFSLTATHDEWDEVIAVQIQATTQEGISFFNATGAAACQRLVDWVLLG